MSDPAAIIKKAVRELQNAISRDESELETYVFEKNLSILKSKKILERLIGELSDLESGKTVNFLKREQGISQTKVIQNHARIILQENGGAMKKTELLKKIVLLGVSSRDPEQLIRRAIIRDEYIDSYDGVCFLQKI